MLREVHVLLFNGLKPLIVLGLIGIVAWLWLLWSKRNTRYYHSSYEPGDPSYYGEPYSTLRQVNRDVKKLFKVVFSWPFIFLCVSVYMVLFSFVLINELKGTEEVIGGILYLGVNIGIYRMWAKWYPSWKDCIIVVLFFSLVAAFEGGS